MNFYPVHVKYYSTFGCHIEYIISYQENKHFDTYLYDVSRASEKLAHMGLHSHDSDLSGFELKLKISSINCSITVYDPDQVVMRYIYHSFLFSKA